MESLKVEVLRGASLESQHEVHAVIVDESGKLVQSYGDANFLTFPRSAIKMLQALPLLESGAADHYQLSDSEICLACASHHAEKEHLQLVSRWLDKISLNESFLACGPQKPVNEQALCEMYKAGLSAAPLMNNCSGKHTGFLTTCQHLQEDPRGYEKFAHPVQKRLRKVLSETMRIDHDKLAYGIDGCSIVTYATPLQNIAIGMSTLINPKESVDRKTAAQRILKAVTSEPFYLAGTGDFTTVVNQKTQGRSVVKVGAEGVYAGVLPEKGLAFAIKAVDGAKRAAEVATAQLLLRLGGIATSEVQELKQFVEPTLVSWRGEPVGVIKLR